MYVWYMVGTSLNQPFFNGVKKIKYVNKLNLSLGISRKQVSLVQQSSLVQQAAVL